MILIEEALAIDGVVSFKSLVAVKGVKEARDHITTARLLDLAALCDDVLIDFCFGLVALNLIEVFDQVTFPNDPSLSRLVVSQVLFVQ
jgi:hypothetical protein